MRVLVFTAAGQLEIRPAPWTTEVPSERSPEVFDTFAGGNTEIVRAVIVPEAA